MLKYISQTTGFIRPYPPFVSTPSILPKFSNAGSCSDLRSHWLRWAWGTTLVRCRKRQAGSLLGRWNARLYWSVPERNISETRSGNLGDLSHSVKGTRFWLGRPLWGRDAKDEDHENDWKWKQCWTKRWCPSCRYLWCLGAFQHFQIRNRMTNTFPGGSVWGRYDSTGMLQPRENMPSFWRQRFRKANSVEYDRTYSNRSVPWSKNMVVVIPHPFGDLSKWVFWKTSPRWPPRWVKILGCCFLQAWHLLTFLPQHPQI